MLRCVHRAWSHPSSAAGGDMQPASEGGIKEPWAALSTMAEALACGYQVRPVCDEEAVMSGVQRLAMASMAAALMGVVLQASVRADAASDETMSNVRRALERLPYYGVFDFLAFNVQNDVVVLRGYAHRPALKREAEEIVRRATKLDISNQMEVLPASSHDDRIRWDTFQQIYTDAIADKYVKGGAMRARYELLDMIRFPGMEPYGTYPVHIIVKHRRLALIGVVDNETDKAVILTRARHVGATRGVEDLVMVRPS